ncbi:hypothetical protein [Neobacillus sp. FSL H8-0543]|uniref:hypothetical protein n=1 Tax=Neobacillus sp. FSL H8-0543 TaxID=2954672 RepID=UPI0031583483
MKRLDFFKEMGGSLFQTVKSVYEPFIQGDLEKIELVTDRSLGISWIPLMSDTEMLPVLELKFIAGRPVIVAMKDSNMQAWNGICPVCSYIITVSTLYSTVKCLNCQKEYNFKTNNGDLQLKSLPVRKRDQAYQIGVVKGDFHA